MNSDKNYDIFILEKQLLFNLVKNAENSIKNDYFVTISISCENNNGTIKKSININLSSMALNIAMGNNLKIIIDNKVISLIAINNIYETINDDEAIFLLKILSMLIIQKYYYLGIQKYHHCLLKMKVICLMI